MKYTLDNLMKDFTAFVMKQAKIEDYKIRDYDIDRVYLDVGGETDNYTIRMWNMTKTFIVFSLFRMENDCGKEVLSSQIYRINRILE